jgi:hypothetical protein
MPICNICGTGVQEGNGEDRRHVRSHGADTYYTDCFGDPNGKIVHPLTGEEMTKESFEALRKSLRNVR